MTFTIEQFRKYVEFHGNLGDIAYNLSEEGILEANKKMDDDEIPEEKSYKSDEFDNYGMVDWRETQDSE